MEFLQLGSKAVGLSENSDSGPEAENNASSLALPFLSPPFGLELRTAARAQALLAYFSTPGSLFGAPSTLTCVGLKRITARTRPGMNYKYRDEVQWRNESDSGRSDKCESELLLKSLKEVKTGHKLDDKEIQEAMNSSSQTSFLIPERQNDLNIPSSSPEASGL